VISTQALERPRRTQLRCGNLEICEDGTHARLSGRPIDLTAREFQLLLALAQRRNRVVARTELYELVWRRWMPYRDRSVDVFVRKLRIKLGAAAPDWVFIHTHFGVGYRFAPERRS
jgi:DNA-binding response OmpR family regulator